MKTKDDVNKRFKVTKTKTDFICQIDDNWIVKFPRELFKSPFRMKAKLTEKQFKKWQDWFYLEFVKCDMWSCERDGEMHSISDMCGCGSIWETYRNHNHPEMYDPLFTGYGWTSYLPDGTSVPAEDGDKNWKEYCFKRSCISCTGRMGEYVHYKCKHTDHKNCKDDCFKHVFSSWCPIMNTFREREGKEVDRKFEKRWTKQTKW